MPCPPFLRSYRLGKDLHENDEPSRTQGRRAPRRRPLARDGAAHVRHEADSGRAPHPDQPRGAHALFRDVARTDRRSLRIRRRAYRYRSARPVCGGAALSGRGDRPRSRRTPRDLPLATAGPLRSPLAQYWLDAEHRRRAGRERACHPGQTDRWISAPFRGAADPRSRAQGPCRRGAGRRGRRRRRALAGGRASLATRGEARRLRCERTIVRAGVRCPQHSAQLSRGISRALP